MKKILVFLGMLQAIGMTAQSFEIGHHSANFTDVSRNNRSVPVEIYYPSLTAGDDVSVANGAFPVVAFGHGFVMGYDSYENIWTSLVSEGYIVAMVNTETSFSPSHEDFGKDLAFVIDQVIFEGSNASSLLVGAVSNSTAVMGHSMGGGASFLAVSNSDNIDCIVTLAAAETTPSAIAAAGNITIPSLILAGSNDCVAPIADHQQPLHDALASTCKSMAILNGGNHCQFANYNLTCSFGELTCGTPATITETEQHDAAMNLILPWLNFYLKNQCADGNTFQDNLSNNAVYGAQQNCDLLCADIIGIHSPSVEFYPNPANEQVTIAGISKNTQIQIFNAFGEKIFQKTFQSSEGIDCRNWPSGIYFIVVQGDTAENSFHKIVIAH